MKKQHQEGKEMVTRIARPGGVQVSQVLKGFVLGLTALLVSGCSTLGEGLKSTWVEEEYPALNAVVTNKVNFSYSGDFEADKGVTEKIEKAIVDFLASENLGNPFSNPQEAPLELQIEIDISEKSTHVFTVSNETLAQELYVWTIREAANTKLAEQMWNGFQRGLRKAIETEADLNSNCTTDVVSFFGQQAVKSQTLEVPANLICKNISKIYDAVIHDLDKVDKYREKTQNEIYIAAIVDLSESTSSLDNIENISKILDNVAAGSYLSSSYEIENRNVADVSIEFITRNSSQSKKFNYSSRYTSSNIEQIIDREFKYFEEKVDYWERISDLRQNLKNDFVNICSNQASNQLNALEASYSPQDISFEIINFLCKDYVDSLIFVEAVMEYASNPGVESGSDILGAVENSLNDFLYATKDNSFDSFELFIASDLKDTSINLENASEQVIEDQCNLVKSAQNYDNYKSIENFSVTLIGAGNSVYSSEITEKYIRFWSCYFKHLNADVFQTTTITK